MLACTWYTDCSIFCCYGPDRSAYMLLPRSWELPYTVHPSKCDRISGPISLTAARLSHTVGCLHPLTIHVHTHTRTRTRTITGRSSSLVHDHSSIPLCLLSNLLLKLSELRVMRAFACDLDLLRALLSRLDKCLPIIPNVSVDSFLKSPHPLSSLLYILDPFVLEQEDVVPP